MAIGSDGGGGFGGFLYGCLMSSLSPFLFLHLQYRRLQGLEHSRRWKERLGHASRPRPPGALVWFHAVSVGMCLQFHIQMLAILYESSTVRSVVDYFFSKNV